MIRSKCRLPKLIYIPLSKGLNPNTQKSGTRAGERGVTAGNMGLRFKPSPGRRPPFAIFALAISIHGTCERTTKAYSRLRRLGLLTQMLLDKRWKTGNFAMIGRKLGNFH